MGKVVLRFKNKGVNSQSKKNRGKITISIQNKGTNARAPKSNVSKKAKTSYNLEWREYFVILLLHERNQKQII